MSTSSPHTFHIPVMGLAYSIDTPIKIAHFGISSVVSIVDDHLIEKMRYYYCKKKNVEYIPIAGDDIDHRAKRITAYLNLLDSIVKEQTDRLKNELFEDGTDIVKYFELLPSSSSLKRLFEQMKSLTDGEEKQALQHILRGKIVAGSIDVNIMTKCDKTNYSPEGNPLPPEYADAMASLRGFAMSKLSSSVVFSAGLNPRLYSYCASFNDFFPDEEGMLKKKIILKVSDYRSALVQGKFLAKKGLWVSEFRIESGLNCGGHAFATEGLLLGPILEEFKEKRTELISELTEICNKTLAVKKYKEFIQPPQMTVTVQGGIGTANEHKFLLAHYGMNSTGWGSPFLLVPEVTNVDKETLHQLANAKKEDYYLSHSSPLGIPFNNFRKSSSEAQRKERIIKNRPGSPCYKKFLAFNTEFAGEPLCTASRKYQHLKIKQAHEKSLPPDLLNKELAQITEKDCLCEGLAAPALLKNDMPLPHGLSAVTICPGPNLAYFSGIFSLREMVAHIYGNKNILNSQYRSHMFINELNMYLDYLVKEIEENLHALTAKKASYLQTFKENLLKGIQYYKDLIPSIKIETSSYLNTMQNELMVIENSIREMNIHVQVF